MKKYNVEYLETFDHKLMDLDERISQVIRDFSKERPLSVAEIVGVMCSIEHRLFDQSREG